MIGVSFIRMIRGALQNFFRNIWLSIATMMIMTMTLLIVLFLYFANVFGFEIIKNVQQKVDLSVVFKQEATSEKMESLARQIEARHDVSGVQIITSEQAKEIFLRNNQDKPFIEESLRELGENPLPAKLFVVASDPQYYKNIADYLQAERFSEIIEEVQYEDSRLVIDKLISIISAIKSAGLAVTIIFTMLVVLIMFNTVRLAIYSFREEIDIMRLVGASRWFIRGPFVLESILVALLSVGISSATIFPALRGVSPRLQQFFFEGYFQKAPFDIYEYALENWMFVVGLQLAVAVGLAMLSSMIAIQRYLKA